MRYVFIVTYGRSGSTLLQTLLNALPGYQIRGENNDAFLHLFRAWRALHEAYALSGVIEKQLETPPNHPWYGLENSQAAPFGKALVDAFINHVLRPDPSTRVSGFKEIRFHHAGDEFEAFLDFIHAHFPSCRFIFNTRNHADVLKSGWWPDWYEAEPDVVMDILTRSDRYFKAYLEKHPERGILMHYDDYTADRSLFRGVFDLMGEVYDADLVDRVMDRRLDHDMWRT